MRKYFIELNTKELLEVTLHEYKQYNGNKFRIRNLGKLKLIYHYKHNKSKEIPVRIINIRNYDSIKKLKLELNKLFNLDIDKIGIKFEFNKYDKEIIKLKNKLKRRNK